MPKLTEEQAQLIANQIAEKYTNLECDACAKEIAKSLREDFKVTFERLRTADRSDIIIHLGSGRRISVNKVHLGVRIGDKIFDNLHHDGISAERWPTQFSSVTGVPLIQKSHQVGDFFGRIFLKRKFYQWLNGRQ